MPTPLRRLGASKRAAGLVWDLRVFGATTDRADPWTEQRYSSQEQPGDGPD